MLGEEALGRGSAGERKRWGEEVLGEEALGRGSAGERKCWGEEVLIPSEVVSNNRKVGWGSAGGWMWGIFP